VTALVIRNKDNKLYNEQKRKWTWWND